MSQILADIYKTDRYVNSEYTLVLAADTTRFYEAVFNHYGYTAHAFTNTIEHYLSRPSKLKTIYSKAKEIIEEQESMVNEIIASTQRMDSLMAPYKKIVKNADSVVNLPPRERALRWVMLPLTHPRWSFSYNDSIKELYENPQMDIWWLNNFKKDTTTITLKFDFVDEKNMRAIRVPLTFHETYLQRAINPER